MIINVKDKLLIRNQKQETKQNKHTQTEFNSKIKSSEHLREGYNVYDGEKN